MKNSKSIIALATACALACCLGLSACGSSSSSASGNLKDGSYTGVSEVLDANVDGDGYVELQVTVSDGKVSSASYQAFEPDGTLKDKNYGKNTSYYGVAQKALETGDEYLAQFIETGDPAAIDTVSGATYMHDMFVEAAEDALSQASS